MSAAIKRWAVPAVIVIFFAFAGWQAARWVGSGETMPPKNAPRRTLPPVRNIARPEPVEIAEASLPSISLWSEIAGVQHATPTDSGQPAIRIITGFESSPQVTVTRVSDTHWLVDNRRYFFLFHVEGVKGQTLTFELAGAPDRWSVVNPVYSYTQSLDDLSGFISKPVPGSQTHQAPNGAQLPDTTGQSWQYIEDTKFLDQTFWFQQKFDRDAYVCVSYPYTPSYHQQYLDSLTNNPAVSVITVGSSQDGRPLRVVKIGEGTEADERRKPCVMIYAREYAYQQDASWVAQGAIDFLISDNPEARRIRQASTFLIIPMLDPDGSAHSLYTHITWSFLNGAVTPESAVYGRFFRAWADQGMPLQLAFNLMQGHTAAHLQNTTVEPDPKRGNDTLTFYSQFLAPPFQNAGFRLPQGLGKPNILTARFGEWLRMTYGTLHIPLEVNGQEMHRHLTLAELRQIGALLVSSAAGYVSSPSAAPLIADVKRIRDARDLRWTKYRDVVVAQNAIEAEAKCQKLGQPASPKP